MFKKLVGLLAVVAAGIFWVSTASAEITDSTHDFRGSLSIDEICVVCHAPHENSNAAATLLWNRAASTNVGNFVPYDSPTLDGASGQPDYASLLCLSCHDGSIAVDAYGGADGTAGKTIDGTNFGALRQFTLDLQQDHPVGITYATGSTNADSEMNALGDAVTFGNGAGEVVDMLFPDGAGGVTVECGSCHDVHNTLSAGNTQLLNVDNTGSGLCLACHNK